MNRILELQISFPDFQLNQIIDPDQVDTNNLQIVNKVNSVITAINTFTQSTTGAKEITIEPLPEFPTATNIQTALTAISAYVKTADSNITSSLSNVINKNIEQDTRLTAVESKNTNQDTRLTAIETKNTTQDSSIANLQTRMTTTEATDTTQNADIVKLKADVSKNTTDVATINQKHAQDVITLTQSIKKVDDDSKAKDVEQDAKLTSLEAKNTQQDATLGEHKVSLDMRAIDVVNINKRLDSIAEVNPNVEVAEARKSGVTQNIFPNLKARIDDVETQVSQIDPSVTVDKVIGLPAELDKKADVHTHPYASTTHTHTKAQVTDFAHTHTKSQITDFPTSLPANGGNADTLDGKHATDFATSTHTHLGQPSFEMGQYLDFHKVGSSTDYDARMWVADNNSLWFNDASGIMCYSGEINNLKSSVVSGKQEVVNAINDKVGSSTGLTTNHTHADYAWHIRNSITSISDKKALCKKMMQWTSPKGNWYFGRGVDSYNGGATFSGADVAFVLVRSNSTSDNYAPSLSCTGGSIVVVQSGGTGSETPSSPALAYSLYEVTSPVTTLVLNKAGAICFYTNDWINKFII